MERYIYFHSFSRLLDNIARLPPVRSKSLYSKPSQLIETWDDEEETRSRQTRYPKKQLAYLLYRYIMQHLMQMERTPRRFSLPEKVAQGLRRYLASLIL